MAFWQIFTAGSPYKKRAKSAAIVWTLLIFIACLFPGRELPHVDVPLIDKWTHFVLFGGFTFLWLLAVSGKRTSALLLWTFLGCLLGWFVEELQGLLPALGRSRDGMDIVADALGALLGSLVFYFCARFAASRNDPQP
jgi:VanZ family protein